MDVNADLMNIHHLVDGQLKIHIWLNTWSSTNTSTLNAILNTSISEMESVNTQKNAAALNYHLRYAHTNYADGKCFQI